MRFLSDLWWLTHFLYRSENLTNITTNPVYRRFRSFFRILDISRTDPFDKGFTNNPFYSKNRRGNVFSPSFRIKIISTLVSLFYKKVLKNLVCTTLWSMDHVYGWGMEFYFQNKIDEGARCGQGRAKPL